MMLAESLGHLAWEHWLKAPPIDFVNAQGVRV